MQLWDGIEMQVLLSVQELVQSEWKMTTTTMTRLKLLMWGHLLFLLFECLVACHRQCHLFPWQMTTTTTFQHLPN
jgi:hypothetical protein